MILTDRQRQQLCQLAQTAAIEAGDYIASVDRQQLQVEHKTAGGSLASQVVTTVDRHCDQLIRQRLLPVCQQLGLGLLTEEGGEARTGADKLTNRLQAPYFWCVDPLDGTLPFIEGRAGFAVAIALVSQQGQPEIGVVYDPQKKDLYCATRGGGAHKNHRVVAFNSHAADPDILHVMADRSFESQKNYSQIMAGLEALSQQWGAQDVAVHYGSGAVINACQLLNHPLACYFKPPKADAGGGSLWDFAASACLLTEAGGWASNMAGQPLDLNRPDSTFMNHQGALFASNRNLARELVAMVAQATRS